MTPVNPADKTKNMMLQQMPRVDVPFGPYTRADGEVFAVTGTIWDSPSQFDYWPGAYVAHHATWGSFRMVLNVPKRIAQTYPLAVALLGGAPLDQVKSELMKATASGRDFIFVPSNDGWLLIG